MKSGVYSSVAIACARLIRHFALINQFIKVHLKYTLDCQLICTHLLNSLFVSVTQSLFDCPKSKFSDIVSENLFSFSCFRCSFSIIRKNFARSRANEWKLTNRLWHPPQLRHAASSKWRNTTPRTIAAHDSRWSMQSASADAAISAAHRRWLDGARCAWSAKTKQNTLRI